MAESKYGKHIVSDLRTTRFSPEFNAKYAKWATRILWMDGEVVPGAFQMNCDGPAAAAEQDADGTTTVPQHR